MSRTASDDELNISFNPSPNYALLFQAAAGSSSQNNEIDWMHGARVETVEEMRSQLQRAALVVQTQNHSFILEALMKQTT